MLPVAYHPAYVASGMPATHRFPMGKFRAVAERLVADGVVAGWNDFLRPEPASPGLLALAHDPAYVARVLNAAVPPAEARRIGFPMTESVAMRARCAVAGTLLCARAALETGAACNAAGGSHHARHETGAGFCVFNDVAVAARALLGEGAVRRVLVIDLDVHQGDGTARIFERDPRVFTLSLHCGKNWPREKAVSDLDVEVELGAGDDDYLAIAEKAVADAIERARPDLVFYVAGVDPHAEDRLGLLALSDAGLARREAMVAEHVMGRAKIPFCGVLGGGYSRDLDALAGRHAQLHKAASHGLRRWG